MNLITDKTCSEIVHVYNSKKYIQKVFHSSFTRTNIFQKKIFVVIFAQLKSINNRYWYTYFWCVCVDRMMVSLQAWEHSNLTQAKYKIVT